jgi:hypothetical protein
LFGTSDCPSKNKQLPKNGHCEAFQLNAKTHLEVETLIEADAKRYNVRIPRLPLGMTAAAIAEAD